LAKLEIKDREELDDQAELEEDCADQDDFDDLEALDDLEDADDFEDADELEETEEASAPGRDPLEPIVPTPGCAVSFYLDNKRHHAVCLAVIGEELLLEHKGASRCYLFTGKVLQIVQRLRFGVASATITVGALKPCRYRSVPKRWLQQLIRTGQTWKGIERGGGLAPLPGDLLKDDGQLELF
jgi:hypothetical protein